MKGHLKKCYLSKTIILMGLFFTFTHNAFSRSPAVLPTKRISVVEQLPLDGQQIAAIDFTDGPAETIQLGSRPATIAQVKPISFAETIPWATFLTLFTVFIALPLSIFWGIRQSLKHTQEDLDYSEINPPSGDIIHLDHFRNKNAPATSEKNREKVQDQGNVVSLPRHKEAREAEEKKKVG